MPTAKELEMSLFERCTSIACSYRYRIPDYLANSGRTGREGSEWRIQLRSDENVGDISATTVTELQHIWSEFDSRLVKYLSLPGRPDDPQGSSSLLSGHWGHVLQRRICCYGEVTSSISFPSLECVEVYVCSPLHPYDVVPFLAL
jgi:hypothetical protein